MQTIVVRPLFTEKSMKDAENSKFTFAVALFADKDAIKKEIEKMYGVTVEDIATTVMKNKGKRVGKKRTKKILGKEKKAIVRITKGQKIDAFELGEKKK